MGYYHEKYDILKVYKIKVIWYFLCALVFKGIKTLSSVNLPTNYEHFL
jgi:hypothetical protein